MAIPKITGAQRDFSAGEVDVTLKRADEIAVMKTGMRQMANWRILNSKTVTNRPGRSALFLDSAQRVDEVLMSPGNKFYLAFGSGYLRVYNAAGTKVFDTNFKGDGVTGIPWVNATIPKIVWDIYGLSIYICYGDGVPLNVPQVLTWDGVSQASTWTLSTYALDTFYGWQKRTPFYRIAPTSIFIWMPSSSPTYTMVASAAYFTAAMVGSIIRWANYQFQILAFNSSTNVTVGAPNGVPQLTEIGLSTGPPAGQFLGSFNAGNIVEGSSSGAQGVVIAYNGTNLFILQLNNKFFTTSDTIVGPTGNTIGTITVNASTFGAVSSSGISIWDEEVMNNVRGWPRSCFVDQGRLGFCDFPAVPQLICWSSIGDFTDQYTDSLNAGPDNAIQEIAPGKSQALYVLAGMESSEFVFCDNAVYYIPISPANPLKPGSVAFNQLSSHGCQAGVPPRRAEQSIIFMRSGNLQVGAVQIPGAYYRPNIIDDVSEMHSHLFSASAVVAIAIPAGSLQFEERYIYMVLANGHVVVGRYSMRQGLIEPGPEGKPAIGWSLWTGSAFSTWASAQGTDVIFTSAYLGVVIIEALDNSQYLDGALLVNSLPAPFAPPAGKGPLYNLPGPNKSVTLMDQGTRMMGTYQIDANGFIVAQGNAGENLASAQLVAGQPWTATLEPFVPDAQPGQSVHQRMFKRRVSRMAVYVRNSTGFLMARLFSGPLTRTSPALGTTMNTYRVPAWNQDDDPTQPPPLREEAQRWRPLGRAFDPRVAVIKDTPGPLEISEIGIEASI